MNEKRRLSGIMFTDVVGYSAIMDKNESAAMKLLENHKNITKPIIESYNGKILKPQGDGFMIEFSSVVDAVRCGTDIQKEISNYNSDKNEDDKIRLRIGIHMGDLIIKDNDIYGHDVNIASRIEKLSDPGGICISQTVYDQIKNKVEIETLDLGETELKNIKDKVNIYKVLLEAQEKINDSDANSNSKSEQEKKTKDESEDNIKEAIKEKLKDSFQAKIPNIDIDIEDGDEKIKIDSDGIKVTDKDGTNVEIGLSGIKVNEKDGTNVEIGLGGINIKDKDGKSKKPKKKKISNFGKAITKLIAGSGFVVLITGILTDLYSFWYGIIGLFAIGILASALKSLLGEDHDYIDKDGNKRNWDPTSD